MNRLDIGTAIEKVPGDVPGTIIRKFTNYKINEAIDQALKAVPEGREGVILGTASLDGAHVGLARIGDQWSVALAVGTDYHHLEAELAVRFAWGGGN